MAVWEMTSLIIAPKKVFRSIYYHKQTKNTWHRPDPSFTYLLSLFLFLTSLAWSFAYLPLSFPQFLRVACMFIFVHFLFSSLVVSTMAYFLVGRLLGPGSKGFMRGLPSGMGGRRRGLFTESAGPGQGGGGSGTSGEELEFGYCFDVAIRAFFPVWVFLYVVQFIMMPLVSRDHWISLFLGNALYLIALSYYTIITFLGYNALPFLHHTELLLTPTFLWAVLWIGSLFGVNLTEYISPVRLTGAPLRS
ncbi:MAG: hypothetical protein M1817_004301 [Caeruleum heppii]|nr:MAG: hypothetical protein M1817_004301 [Caeruleum heppii]